MIIGLIKIWTVQSAMVECVSWQNTGTYGYPTLRKISRVIFRRMQRVVDIVQQNNHHQGIKARAVLQFINKLRGWGESEIEMCELGRGPSC